MPRKTILEIAADEQAAMLKELRATRYGYLLALHILLLCAVGRTPSEIASFLFCSRSSIYRIVAAYKRGERWLADAEADSETRRSWPSLKRSLVALIKRTPSAFGWCRVRWSCATLALQLHARPGVRVSRETIRRWLHELGYSWKRARHTARDDDPERAAKLARIRSIIEGLLPTEARFFADELDIHLLAKIGYAWMPKGTQVEVMTPGTNQKNYLAGALNYLTGKMLAVVGERKNRWLFLDLLKVIDHRCLTVKFTRIYVVVDNYRIHTAQAVVAWLAAHPRFELVFLPAYCPRANPVERAFGDVHDKCTRNHKRTRISDLVGDVIWHLKGNGPWCYKLSDIYHTPEVDQALAELVAARKLKAA
ncbi:MAG: IS630 family transposase [Acidobacteria bacterium]|nr:IS630 family transposase [Acidobacteriota bacterium]MDQ3585736.1 IS630 family transposase [Acidobacteriota bacterium]